MTQVLLQHVESARQARDPMTVDLLIQLITAPRDPTLPPPRDGVYSFDKFLAEISARTFYSQPAEQQAQQRVEKIQALESEDADEPLEEKYQSHHLILSLWQSGDSFDRQCLLEIIRKVPLVYGPWKALKRIYKESELADDTEVYGALSARFDTAFSTGQHSVSQRTLGYLVRRSWRYLRRVAEGLPVCYADTAVDFLVGYEEHAYLANSWLFNQIFQHDKKSHKRTRFHFSYNDRAAKPNEYPRARAWPELWKRSPLPLFSLLQHARHPSVLEYAVVALKADFRTVLREIEPRWVRQLIYNDRPVVHKFVIWILENVPKFEQSKFQSLELHEPVLMLLDSPDSSARAFAAKYARVHARDMDVSELVRLANSSDNTVRSLAKDLLNAYDPRAEVGLEAWGKLLETKNGHQLAVEALRKHFTADDLTPEWFKARLMSRNELGAGYARQRLLEVHKANDLGPGFFFQLFDEGLPTIHGQTIRYAVDQLEKFDLEAVDVSWLEQILICSATRATLIGWISTGKLNPSRFDVDFLKSISFHPTFEDCPQVNSGRAKPWGDYAVFDEGLSHNVFYWLSDVRQFTPDQIGFQWLMQLVQRDEPLYHDFASDLMIKSYLPADFAAPEESSDDAQANDDAGEINIDFQGETFVFTGKLATMTRSEAQKKVAAANGKKAGTVGKTLGYLVIGDEGSPMYGMGRKGSKQVKAESLNEGGAAIKIISETAFLQMLSGTQREFSDDAVQNGCEALWEMLIDNKEGSPLSRFANKYIRHHHPEICLAETDRPVDPGAEIPDEFLNFENLSRLLTDKRKPLRELGLEICKFEFARVSPSLEQLLDLSQLPFPAVRKFVAESLTAEPTVQNRKWLLDPDTFSAHDVYQFCQSRDKETRAIGMKLIDAHPRLREPDQLFALTESPDRNVRAFVIRSFWSLYHDRGVKESWVPAKQPDLKEKEEGRFGVGAPPRPEQLPASHDRMQFLLRRMLFEISPGRPPKLKGDEIDDLKIKPLPTRRSKILLIETLRDIAIDDFEFASAVLPVLQEFMESHGMSEHAACLVAVTRVEHAHPQLKSEVSDES